MSLWFWTASVLAITFILLRLRSYFVNPPQYISHLLTLPVTTEFNFKTDKVTLYKTNKSFFNTPLVAARAPFWGVGVNDAYIAEKIYKVDNTLSVLSNQDTNTYPKREISAFELSTFIGQVMGVNIVSVNGDEWKRHRRIVNPAFHRSWATDSFGLLTNRLLDEWSKIDNSPIEIYYWMQRLTLDALGLQAFNFDFDSLRDSNSKWVQDYHNITKGMNKPLYLFFPFLDEIAKRLPFTQKLKDRYREWESLADFNSFLHNLIDKRLNEIQNSDSNDEHKDLLTLMVEATKELRPKVESEEEDTENSRKLTIKELRNDLLIFLIAGHDPSAFTLVSCIYNMAKYPEIQKKAREEVEAVLQGNERRSVPSFEQQRKFLFIEAIIKETLRLYPPLPSVPLRLNTTELELNNTKLPIGTGIMLNILAIQRNSSYWEDPDSFDPYRFYDDTTKQLRILNVPPCAWEPFGAGARMCVGMNFALIEQRTVLAMILRNYEWSLPGDSIHKEDIQVEFGILLSSKPMPIKFKRLQTL